MPFHCDNIDSSGFAIPESDLVNGVQDKPEVTLFFHEQGKVKLNCL